MNIVRIYQCYKIKATLACCAITYVFYIQWKPEITWTPDPVNWRHMNPVCQTKAYSLAQGEEIVQNSSFSREGHTAMTHCTTRALEELCLEKGTWFFSSSYRKLSQGKSSSLKWRVWGTWLMGKHCHLQTYCTGFIPQTVSHTVKTSIWFASHRSASRTVPLKWQKRVDRIASNLSEVRVKCNDICKDQAKKRQLFRSQLEEGQALSCQGSASILTVMSGSEPWEYGLVTILSCYYCRRGHRLSASFLRFSFCDNGLNQTHCLLASPCPLIAGTLLSCGWSWQTHSQRLREYSHCRPFLLFLSFKEMGEMLAIQIGVFFNLEKERSLNFSNVHSIT